MLPHRSTAFSLSFTILSSTLTSLSVDFGSARWILYDLSLPW